MNAREVAISLYYRLAYRPIMKTAHRYGWHRMKHINPHPIDDRMPHGFLRCDWCGISCATPEPPKETLND